MRLTRQISRGLQRQAVKLLSRIAGAGHNFRTRLFDASAGDSRWAGTPTFGMINPEILQAGTRLRARSRYHRFNNAHLANAAEAFKSNVVGAGIKAASRHPDPAKRRQIQQAWDFWAIICDADGVSNFGGLQALAVEEMFTSGEVFAQLLMREDGFKVRLLQADLIDEGYTVPAPPENPYVVAGIKFAPDSRILGYFVRPILPEELYTAAYYPPVFVDAADICHVFRPLGAGQIRGIPWAHAVLTNLQELDQLRDAQLVQQKVSAMFSAIAVDLNQTVTGNPFDGNARGNVLESGLEPGTLKILPSGYDIKFATPNAASEGVPFIKSELRAIAAGLGLPDYLLTGDLSEINYSSIRASLVEFRRRVVAIQQQIIIHQFCRPIYQRFITVAVLNGTIEAPDFEENLADYLSVSWHPPAQDWVDPLKDAEADNLAIGAGLKSRREVVAELGRDIDELDDESAADKAREKQLGIGPFIPATAITDRPQEIISDN